MDGGVEAELGSQEQGVAVNPTEFLLFAKSGIEELSADEPPPDGANLVNWEGFKVGVPRDTGLGSDWDSAQIESGRFRFAMRMLIKASCDSLTGNAIKPTIETNVAAGPEFGLYGKTQDPPETDIRASGSSYVIRYVASGWPEELVIENTFQLVAPRTNKKIFQVGQVTIGCDANKKPTATGLKIFKAGYEASSKFPTHRAWLFPNDGTKQLLNNQFQLVWQQKMRDLWTLPPVLSLADTLSNGLWGWANFTTAPSGTVHTYKLSRDPSVGSPSPPSAVVNGQYACTASPCYRFGMSKTFSIQSTGDITLGFTYRAGSGYAASTVTNAYLLVMDSAGAVILDQTLTAGGTYLTSWIPKSITIPRSVLGTTPTIRVAFNLIDAWSYDWAQHIWFDAFTIRNTTSTCGGSGQTCCSGSCNSGLTCSNNVCVASCTKTSCQAQGKNCGTISDGCGGTLTCGSCTSPQTCGGGGVANVCGTTSCTPTTCAAQGKNCGTISNGCGGTLTCGSCTSPQTCGGGGVANVCGAPACSIRGTISSGGGTASGTTSGSNTTTGSCISSPGPEAIYTWTPTASGNARIAVTGTGSDLDFYVRTSCSSGEVMCSTAGGFQTISAVAGKTYYIFVDSKTTSTVSYTVTVTRL